MIVFIGSRTIALEENPPNPNSNPNANPKPNPNPNRGQLSTGQLSGHLIYFFFCE